MRSAHVKVTNLAEVSLAVVLRELWLLLLDGSTDWQLYLSLAAVVVALAGSGTSPRSMQGRDGGGTALTAPEASGGGRRRAGAARTTAATGSPDAAPGRRRDRSSADPRSTRAPGRCRPGSSAP